MARLTKSLPGSLAGFRRSTRESPDRALDLLPPETVASLADLNGASDAAAQTVLQLLPFGSRAALEELQIVTRGPNVDSHGHSSLHLTPFGFDVIDAAARKNLADPEGVQELSARWRQAVEKAKE